MTNRGRANDTSQTIINGTLSAMADESISNLTTKSISKKAGVSTAAIHYFFETKEKLIYHSFVFVIRSIRREMLRVRKAEKDPIDRVREAIRVHFSSTHLSQEAASIWPQLWVYSTYHAETARLFKVFGARMISNFTYDLCQAGLSRRKARSAAIKIRALIIGLWVEKQISKNVSPGECWKIFDTLLMDLTAEAEKSTA